MDWDYPQPFTLPVTPQAGDIDGLNHTNNAVYVRWCEQAGWAHSERLGLSLDDYRRLDRAMAIRRGEYDYLLRVAVKDTRDYERLLREKLYKIKGIRHSKSSFVLRTLKKADTPLTS